MSQPVADSSGIAMAYQCIHHWKYDEWSAGPADEAYNVGDDYGCLPLMSHEAWRRVGETQVDIDL